MNLVVALEIVPADKTPLTYWALVLAVIEMGLNMALDVFLAAGSFLAVVE